MNNNVRFTGTSPAEQLQVHVCAAQHSKRIDDVLFLDFGRAWYGTLKFQVPPPLRGKTISVRLGEKLDSQGRVDRDPPGTIRCRCIEMKTDAHEDVCRVVIPADERNTGAGAVLMPDSLFEVTPFRYVEIEDAADIDPQSVQMLAVHYPFNDAAASFSSSDETLNAVWDLCKHTIKATTFCGVYVDGDRERIPYEGDAYINQLCHYCMDQAYDFARYSHEYLIQYPTWPTEWQLHSVLMAWADYMYAGETASLQEFYEDLKAKTLIELARGDGLISTESELCTRAFEETLHLYHDKYIFNSGLRDLVDWPPGSFTEGGTGERDNHEMLPVNTVVNAFHYHAVTIMVRIARVLGREEDERRFSAHAQAVYQSFQNIFLNPETGIYVDGEGSSHSSLHSNMFALAFDLVPEKHKPQVVEFVKSRGMACSVYGAQYLLEALYLNNEADAALELMRARDDRSWWNMLAAGSSMCLEAWDIKYKNNLDWNHAWGAAPGNIIPRFLAGIRPLHPGFEEIIIQPQPGSLQSFSITHPSPLGPICMDLTQDDAAVHIELQIPAGVRAHFAWPDAAIQLDGEALACSRDGAVFMLDRILRGGRHTIDIQV